MSTPDGYFNADEYLHPDHFTASGPCPQGEQHRWGYNTDEIQCLACGVYYNAWSQNRALAANVMERAYLPRLAATPMHECGPWYECTLCLLNGEPVIVMGKKLPTHAPDCLIIQARVQYNGLSVRDAQIKDWLEELRRR